MTKAAWFLTLAATVPLATCRGGPPELDTRTFRVEYLSEGEVEELVTPYVFTDREPAPGTYSVGQRSLTVRETDDNLDKIGRVLDEYDRPASDLRLHFQLVRADGAGEPDPAIADVVGELRELFRFEGYELLAETVMRVRPESHAQQRIPDTRYEIEARVESRGKDRVSLQVLLRYRGNVLLSTSVTLPPGRTLVLGNTQSLEDEGSLILTVRAEIPEG